MSNDLWRWADPNGQQRRVRLDELRAALAGGHIAPNTPVWRSGWSAWQSAHEVPELTSSALSAANGVVPNIPPPPLAMVAMQHEFESHAGSFSPPAPTVEGTDEPPPPPPYVPIPVKPNSIPPPDQSSGRLPSVGGRSPSPVPPAPGGAPAPFLPSSLPTTIGLPPPPEMVALAAARQAARPPPPPPPRANPSDSTIEEISGEMLLDDVGLPPPTHPIVDGGLQDRSSVGDDVAGLPPRRPQLTAIFEDFKEIRAGRPPKNKLLIGVVGFLAFCVVISLLGLLITLVRGEPSELPTAGASSSSSAASSASASAAPKPTDSAATAAPVVVPPPEPKPAQAESALGDCASAGHGRVISARAVGAAGVEAVSVPGAVAIGFAHDARNGVGYAVDPASLRVTTTLKARAAGGDAHRMTPVFDKGKLALVAGVDKKNDKLQGRRVVATSPLIDVGVAEGSLVWAPHDQSSYAKIFAIEGEGPVDAIRAVPLSTQKGIAVVLRRDSAVYVGVAKGDAVLTAEGSLTRLPSLGMVGSPSVTVSGDTVIVAWSDRASAEEPWQVRWTKLVAPGAPDAPKALALPEGGPGVQAMSPSVAGLGGGRFVVAWSEGTPTHQVRAVTLGADGAASGAAMALSAPGVNAGQPQVAVGPDGRGVVAFLATKGKSFEIFATPLSCAAK